MPRGLQNCADARRRQTMSNNEETVPLQWYEDLGEEIALAALALGADPDILGDCWDADDAAKHCQIVAKRLEELGVKIEWNFDDVDGVSITLPVAQRAEAKS
jgi:hypothetical protein